jgi:hypothetical protein
LLLVSRFILASTITIIYCLDSLLSSSDFFEGGKGPDPKLVKLDNDLDSYFSKQAEAAASTDAAAASADTAMALS